MNSKTNDDLLELERTTRQHIKQDELANAGKGRKFYITRQELGSLIGTEPRLGQHPPRRID